MSDEPQFTIRLEHWAQVYLTAVNGHISDMRQALRAIDDGSFATQASTPSPGAVIHFQHSDADPIEGAAQRATSKCFRMTMANFVELMDRIIAATRVLDRGLKPPASGLPDVHAALEFINEALENEYRTVSMDTAFRSTEKVAYLVKRSALSSESAKTIRSYLAVRRVLEHHGGVPSKAILMFFRDPKVFFAKDGNEREIVGMPAQGEAGESVIMRVVEERRIYEAGGRITFSEADIVRITTGLTLIATELSTGATKIS
jgi:hypothetical protein